MNVQAILFFSLIKQFAKQEYNLDALLSMKVHHLPCATTRSITDLKAL
jgi:hypothetical protein